jgi:hypothetical protein
MERQREMPFSRATINSSHKMRAKQGAALSFFFAAFYERAKRQIIILELSLLSARTPIVIVLLFLSACRPQNLFIWDAIKLCFLVAGQQE